MDVRDHSPCSYKPIQALNNLNFYIGFLKNLKPPSAPCSLLLPHFGSLGLCHQNGMMKQLPSLH